MTMRIPKLSLVVLVGPSGSGKSTFARTHFKPTEVVSSDACRAMLTDDENCLTVNAEAFALVHHIAGRPGGPRPVSARFAARRAEQGGLWPKSTDCRDQARAAPVATSPPAT